MQAQEHLTLGLDLGTNSIGWSLIKHDRDGNPIDIFGLGVRIFQEATEGENRTPKNVKRRTARGARKTLARRKMRRDALRNFLIKNELLPKDKNELNKLFEKDPYELRKRGLDEILELYEFGRVLCHLNKRRGFLSNAKTEKEEEKKELSEYKESIKKLEENIGKRTLGKFLYDIVKKPSHEFSHHTARRRNHHTTRAMYEHELQVLWKNQSSFHPQLHSEKFMNRVKEIILDQRPLKSQENLIGACEFEPNRKRAEKATLEFQAFRIWQDLNNLEINGHKLELDQRRKLFKKLNGGASLTTDKAKELIGIPRRVRRENAFNLTTWEDNKIPYNKTIKSLKGALGERWNKFENEIEELENIENIESAKGLRAIVDDYLSIDVRPTIRAQRSQLLARKQYLEKHIKLGEKGKKLPNGIWRDFHKELASVTKKLDRLPEKGETRTFLTSRDELVKERMKRKFDDETASRLTKMNLEQGYSNLSRKAMRELLKELKKGKPYGEVWSLIYPPKKAEITHTLGEPPDVRNPIVNKALHEVRKVILALIKEHGIPQIIRVEMGSDMTRSKKQREAIEKRQVKERIQNESAKSFWLEKNIVPTKERQIMYRLWIEQERTCIYSGKPIDGAMLTSGSGEVQIDHIWPLSLCWNNSYMNKTLCLVSENRSKGQRTPYQAFGENEKKWNDICVRLRQRSNIPAKKIENYLERNEIKITGFVERQLNDTRYIAVAVKSYLESLGCQIEISKGSATSDIRKFWGLNSILGGEDNSEKKSREDHRHHAVDAIVIALTDRKLFSKLSTIASQNQYGDSREEVKNVIEKAKPWNNFWNDVKSSIDSIAVSHAPSHKITGALHDENPWGLLKRQPNGIERGKARYVNRVSLSSITDAKIKHIQDKVIKGLVEARLEEEGGDKKRAFDNVERPLRHKGGKVPIFSVRVYEDKTSSAVHSSKRGHLAYNSYHHVEILRNNNGENWRGEFVPILVAAERVREAERAKKKNCISNLPPVVQRDHGPDWRFFMALHVNDLVELDYDGKRKLFRVQKMSGANETIDFRLHTAVLKPEKREGETKDEYKARCALHEEKTHINKSASTLHELNPQKVIVSPLGDMKYIKEERP